NLQPIPLHLPSVRGLILGRTRRGGVVPETALRMWLRLNAERFHARKVDLCEPSGHAVLRPLLEEAQHLGIRLSWRTTLRRGFRYGDPGADPAGTGELAALLRGLADAGLFDVLLCV